MRALDAKFPGLSTEGLEQEGLFQKLGLPYTDSNSNYQRCRLLETRVT